MGKRERKQTRNRRQQQEQQQQVQQEQVQQEQQSNRQEPFSNVLKTIDHFFETPPVRGVMESIDEFFSRNFTRSIPIDLYETGDILVISAEIPGVKPEMIHVDIENETLTISVTAQEEQELKNDALNYYRRERSVQRLERTIRLPYPINENRVKATYQNGVLQIRARKRKGKKNGIQIEQ